MKNIFLVSLLIVWLPVSAQSNCPRIVELWHSEQRTHCTGEIGFTVRDLVLQMNGNCGCPGENLAFIEMQRDGMGSIVDGLEGASSVTVSPDGSHVYAVGYWDDAVAVFERDAATGTLVFVVVVRDGVEGVEGLFGSRSVAVSPDGSFVYVVGLRENAIGVFERDPVTGMLTFIEVKRDGVDGVDGLESARFVAVSPDSHHVYVGGEISDAIAVFERDAATGTLVFVAVVRNHVEGVDGLNKVTSVAVSQDGSNVYATGEWSNAIAVFARDADTGRLAFLEVHRDGVDGVDGLESASSVMVSPDGRHVYATGMFESTIAVFARETATGMLTFVGVHRDGVDGVDGLIGASSVTVSLDGNHVYATGEYEDTIAVFERDAVSGSLAFIEVVHDNVGVSGLEGASSVTVSPDGSHVFAVGSWDDAVAVFERDAVTGMLVFVEEQRDGSGGVDGLDTGVSVTVSPGGSHVYAAGYGDDAIAVFDRDADTGRLGFVEMHRDGTDGVEGLKSVRSVTVSPEGNHVYAVGSSDRALIVFERNVSTGRLAFLEVHRNGIDGVVGLLGAWSVSVSPDSRHVYVAGNSDDAIAVFERDAATGMLAFVEVHRDGVEGVDGLEGANSVTVSQDGNNVYAVGGDDDAIAVFERDAASGMLAFVEVHRDGVAGVDGLEGANSVTVSPDGNQVYAVGLFDGALTVFDRNAVTGMLTFVEVHHNFWLSGALSVNVSPDGSYVYATGLHSDAIAVFERDADTGMLTLVELQRDGVDGVEGLRKVYSVAVSPDCQNLYAVGADSNAISAFLIFPPP